jgi:hypothetical protein
MGQTQTSVGALIACLCDIFEMIGTPPAQPSNLLPAGLDGLAARFFIPFVQMASNGETASRCVPAALPPVDRSDIRSGASHALDLNLS